MHISNGQCQVFHEEEHTMWMHVHWDGACQPQSTHEPTDPFNFDSSMSDMETSSFASTHHPSVETHSSQAADSTQTSSAWMDSTESTSYTSSMAATDTSTSYSTFHSTQGETSSFDHTFTDSPSYKHTTMPDYSSTDFPSRTDTSIFNHASTDYPSQPGTMDYDDDETSMGMFDPTMMGMYNVDCEKNCPAHWIEDGICDQHCVDVGCFDHDGDDCVVDCEHDCPAHWKEDGICDQHCVDEGCFDHDGDDCSGTNDFSMEEDYSMEEFHSMDMPGLYNLDPTEPDMELAAEMNPLTFIDFSNPAVQAVAIGCAILLSATIFCWMMREAERRKQTTYQRLLLDAEDDEI